MVAELQFALPVRMKVTPTSATSARPLRPFGAFFPGGGPFESTIGNTRRPSTSSTPVGASIVTTLMRTSAPSGDVAWRALPEGALSYAADPAAGALTAPMREVPGQQRHARPASFEARGDERRVPGAEERAHRRHRRVRLPGAAPLGHGWRAEMAAMPELERVDDRLPCPAEPFARPRLHRRAATATGSATCAHSQPSTAAAQRRPSSIAHTMRDWPRRASPAAKTPGTLAA